MTSIFGNLFKRKPGHTEPRPTPPPDVAATFAALFEKATRAAASRDFEGAISLYDQAIAADPSRPEPYYKRANALKDLGRLEAALASYGQAIERKADYAYAYCNRAFVQHSLGLLPEALESYDRALALDPSDALAHNNRGLLLQDADRWPEALASYERAIAANPEFADAHYNRSVNLLHQGDFERGWRAYESRWQHSTRLGMALRSYPQPRWTGEQPLAGKRLLIYPEQGLGDTIQFARYATLCASRGATVILEVQRPLRNLLAGIEGVSQIAVSGGPLPPFDYHSPLMSLPLAFQTTLDTIPAPREYLHCDPERVADWRARLGEADKPRVGLVWSGNPNNPLDARRSIRLAEWVAHLPPEYQYFALQTEIREDDVATLDESSSIFSYGDELQDFMDNAALCECMDLVVTVDTCAAHLSGALGQKTWLLLAHAPDWRWTRGRTDSGWYPGMRLYQQQTAGDWSEVLARVATDLRKELANAARR